MGNLALIILRYGMRSAKMTPEAAIAVSVIVIIFFLFYLYAFTPIFKKKRHLFYLYKEEYSYEEKKWSLISHYFSTMLSTLSVALLILFLFKLSPLKNLSTVLPIYIFVGIINFITFSYYLKTSSQKRLFLRFRPVQKVKRKRKS